MLLGSTLPNSSLLKVETVETAQVTIALRGWNAGSFQQNLWRFWLTRISRTTAGNHKKSLPFTRCRFFFGGGGKNPMLPLLPDSTKINASTQWQSGVQTWALLMRQYSQHCRTWVRHKDVSENNGTPKSAILIGFSILNHPFGVPLFLETPIKHQHVQ